MKKSVKEDLMFLVVKIMIFLALLGITFGIIFGICRVSGNAMDPACKNGDLILYYRLQKAYQAKDLVVIEKDGERQSILSEGI